jgi:hypothetical protein
VSLLYQFIVQAVVLFLHQREQGNVRSRCGDTDYFADVAGKRDRSEQLQNGV